MVFRKGEKTVLEAANELPFFLLFQLYSANVLNSNVMVEMPEEPKNRRAFDSAQASLAVS